MRIRTLQFLEKFFDALQSWAERMRQRCAVCATCGRNRYTGQPCVGLTARYHGKKGED